MRNQLALLLLLLLHFSLLAQKPVIDTTVYEKWPTIQYPKISNNGNYVSYWVTNQSNKYSTLILSSINNNWKKEVNGIVATDNFTHDSRMSIVNIPGDSLCIFTLGKNVVEYISSVQSYDVIQTRTCDWLVYQLDTPGNTLILRNLQTGKNSTFNGVENYIFNETSSSLVIQIRSDKDSSSRRKLVLVNMIDEKKTPLWVGEQCTRFTFDQSGGQLAFVAEENDTNVKTNTLWLFKIGTEKAISLINKTSIGIPKGRIISTAILNFSEDGSKLFFSIGQDLQNDSWKVGDGVNVWHYKSKYLPSKQFFSPIKHIEQCVIDLLSKKIVVLNDENENIIFSDSKGRSNKYVLIYKDELPDGYYTTEDMPSLYIESILDGKKILLKEHLHIYYLPNLSPKENFVIWFDTNDLSYYSYEITTGVKRNISQSVPYPLYDEDAVKLRGSTNPFGIAGWSPTDHSILIYDRYDIWKVDPTGKESSINITYSTGRSKHIVFGIVTDDLPGKNRIVPVENNILLSGYNRDTKENGFWFLNMSSNLGPQKHFMDSNTYWIERLGSSLGNATKAGRKPIKALEKDVYLITRMNARESPNLLVTTNFLSFKHISDVHPEKQFNWITATLINWKMTDGNLSQGILYKPENFDSTKKYPLIFDYYEKRSDELNAYINPYFSRDRINIPSYVSNGYLVFVPDIYYTRGYNGKSVLNSVLSAVKYLSFFPWVDTTKLGLQGHSFGGWETNYLITHSKLFAAACEASGVSDQVSAYGQLKFESNQTRQSFYETESQGSPYGIGVTPWIRPDLYIDNSPIFKIGDITTPLLMMHNRADASVPFEQAVEFFTGMQRAGKKVWLLEYDKEGHALFQKHNFKDYTIRMKQFFDHYLKGAPAPIWMTRELPMGLEVKEAGLEYDKIDQVP